MCLPGSVEGAGGRVWCAGPVHQAAVLLYLEMVAVPGGRRWAHPSCIQNSRSFIKSLFKPVLGIRNILVGSGSADSYLSA
jgi:hypothetical protein